MRVLALTGLVLGLTAPAAAGPSGGPAASTHATHQIDHADHVQRIDGLVLLAIGAGLILLDLLRPFKRSDARYGDYWIGAPIVALAGLWLLIVGRPVDEAGAEASWGWIGAICAGGVGLIVGIVRSVRARREE
jgi:hypothetical protein